MFQVVRESVIHAPEILAVVDDAPAIKDMMNSLFHCNYADLFKVECYQGQFSYGAVSPYTS